MYTYIYIHTRKGTLNIVRHRFAVCTHATYRRRRIYIQFQGRRSDQKCPAFPRSRANDLRTYTHLIGICRLARARRH